MQPTHSIEDLKRIAALPLSQQPEAYYIPGYYVVSYGNGIDEVLEFHPSNEWRGWYVVVRAITGPSVDLGNRKHFTHPDCNREIRMARNSWNQTQAIAIMR